ncbi:MAG: hypothetical protein Q7U16_12920 [Agitococcus sp.]|nr:hypothetical protein [Agitococcus sp.]
MFSEKFALSNVGLDTLVEDVLNSPASLRSQGFLKYASLVLSWYDKYPELTRVHTLCVTMPTLNNEGNLDIRISHHLSIEAVGSSLGMPLPKLGSYLEEICVNNLPTSLMGSGAHDLSRHDALVQEYLRLAPDNEEGYRKVLQSLAWNMHMSFGTVAVYHEMAFLPSPRQRREL